MVAFLSANLLDETISMLLYKGGHAHAEIDEPRTNFLRLFQPDTEWAPGWTACVSMGAAASSIAIPHVGPLVEGATSFIKAVLSRAAIGVTRLIMAMPIIASQEIGDPGLT